MSKTKTLSEDEIKAIKAKEKMRKKQIKDKIVILK